MKKCWTNIRFHLTPLRCGAQVKRRPLKLSKKVEST